MKVVLCTTMFLSFGGFCTANNAMTMVAPPQHNHIRRAATTINPEEDDEDPSRPDHQQQQPALLSHLRHSLSSTNNNKSDDSNFSRCLNIMDITPTIVEINLDNNCKPAKCPCEKAWFDSLGKLDEETCSTEKMVKFVLKDKIKPVIHCDYTEAQCKGKANVTLKFCEDFKNGKHSPHVFTVTDNCKANFSSSVQDLELTEDSICKPMPFKRIYNATDGCNNATNVTLKFLVDPPTIDVTFPTETIPTVECGENAFPTLTGKQTVCATSKIISVLPPAGSPTKCGQVPVNYTFKTDTCNKVITKEVEVTVTDSAPPVFTCKTTKDCPGDREVWCAPPPPTDSDILCATDCQWSGPVCTTKPIQSTDPNTCAVRNVTRTWAGLEDGCGNTGEDHVQTFTIKPRMPGEPYQKGKPGCGGTPVFCVQVPDCEGILQERCSDKNIGFEVTPGSGSTSSICSEGKPKSTTFNNNVKYTDPDTNCTTSTVNLSYSGTCCCETAWAVWDTAKPENNCLTNFTGLTSSKWGWTMGPIKKGHESEPSLSTHLVYAAAGGCDLSNGYLAGQANVTYTSSGQVTVNVTATAPALFTIAHIWVGIEPLPRKKGSYTAAPGEFNLKSNEYKQGTADTISMTWKWPTGDPGDIYVAVHTESAMSCTAP
ncbi:hypothetical protein ACA910_016333 [Epithemia clementina (nom. ined.)]